MNLKKSAKTKSGKPATQPIRKAPRVSPKLNSRSRPGSSQRSDLFELKKLSRSALLARIADLQKTVHTQDHLLSQAEALGNLGTWEYDPSTDSLTYSRSLAELIGFPSGPQPFPMSALDSVIGPGAATRVRDDLSEVLKAAQRRVSQSTCELASRNSQTHRTAYVPVLDESGVAVRLLGVTQDITQSKAIDQELRRVSHRILTLRNEEQRRMARELHETASQTLAALKLTLGKATRALLPVEGEAAKCIASALALVDDALREVRSVSALLHPPMLEEVGFAAALHAYARTVSDRSGIRIATHIPESLVQMSAEVEIALFRVVQESLTNIHRHAHANSCLIHIAQVGDNVTLKVEDDGIGIPHLNGNGSSHFPAGIGISGMRERITQLDGTFRISSVPRKGTTVHVQLPVRLRGTAAIC
jgi:signal transduction histidine kinase